MEETACIVKCDSYSEGEVSAAIERVFCLLGGAQGFIRQGMKVLIKANLMRKSAPEQCCVTHYSIVAAVASMVESMGATAVICDSPGGAYNHNFVNSIYSATKMTEAAEISGASLNDDFTYKRTVIGGTKLNEIDIITPALECDAIINIAKLKTHAHATYTGAVKNMFGCVPGLEKAELHFNYPDIYDFANAIIDIAQYLKPTLSIIDAVDAMEGNGPGSGEPRHVGAIVASKDMYAADIAATRLVGICPDEVPILHEAKKRGLCDENPSLLGDDPEPLIVHDFKRSDFAGNNVLKHRVPTFMEDTLAKWLALKPVVDRKKCIGCGICAGICPADAIKISRKIAKISSKKCVKCFCCQEFCPKKAIAGKRNPVASTAMRVTED